MTSNLAFQGLRHLYDCTRREKLITRQYELRHSVGSYDEEFSLNHVKCPRRLDKSVASVSATSDFA